MVHKALSDSVMPPRFLILGSLDVGIILLHKLDEGFAQGLGVRPPQLGAPPDLTRGLNLDGVQEAGGVIAGARGVRGEAAHEVLQSVNLGVA